MRRPVTSPVSGNGNIGLGTLAAAALGGGQPTTLAIPAGTKESLVDFEMQTPLILPPGVTLGFSVEYKLVHRGVLWIWWHEDGTL